MARVTSRKQTIMKKDERKVDRTTKNVRRINFRKSQKTKPKPLTKKQIKKEPPMPVKNQHVSITQFEGKSQFESKFQLESKSQPESNSQPENKTETPTKSKNQPESTTETPIETPAELEFEFDIDTLQIEEVHELPGIIKEYIWSEFYKFREVCEMKSFDIDKYVCEASILKQIPPSWWNFLASEVDDDNLQTEFLVYSVLFCDLSSKPTKHMELSKVR